MIAYQLEQRSHYSLSLGSVRVPPFEARTWSGANDCKTSSRGLAATHAPSLPRCRTCFLPSVLFASHFSEAGTGDLTVCQVCCLSFLWLRVRSRAPSLPRCLTSRFPLL